MFDRMRTCILLSSLVALGVAVGCTVDVDDDRNERDKDEDGTVEVERSRASALVTGQVDASISGSVRIVVNDSDRDVVIAPDRTFVVRDVPSGTVTLGCEAGGVRGSLTIDDVKPGERIEVSVRVEGSSVVITITRRSGPGEAPREVADVSGAPVEIRANNVCYYLRPGVYDRDIAILGNNVTLVGAAGCSNRTVLNGTLTVRGNNAVVQDIELRGSVVVTGNNARFQDSCTRCFANACFSQSPGGGNCPPGSTEPTCPGTGSSSGGSTSGGTGTYDAGTGFDAGSSFDGGTTPAPDAGTDGAM